jgi:hypothetical protein
LSALDDARHPRASDIEGVPTIRIRQKRANFKTVSIRARPL